jgi:hypothetical protein
MPSLTANIRIINFDRWSLMWELLDRIDFIAMLFLPAICLKSHLADNGPPKSRWTFWSQIQDTVAETIGFKFIIFIIISSNYSILYLKIWIPRSITCLSTWVWWFYKPKALARHQAARFYIYWFLGFSLCIRNTWGNETTFSWFFKLWLSKMI